MEWRVTIATHEPIGSAAGLASAAKEAGRVVEGERQGEWGEREGEREGEGERRGRKMQMADCKDWARALFLGGDIQSK